MTVRQFTKLPTRFSGATSGLSGIYLIRCAFTQKVYVGSSVNMAGRKIGHLRDLSNKRHHSRKLQAGFNKYGAASFCFEVLEYVEPERNLLIEREQHWIDFYQSAVKGYNISPTASSCLGVIKTPEQRKAIGLKGSKRFRVFSPAGEIFDVLGLAPFCAARNLNSGALNQVARGKLKHHRGWRAEYWGEPFPPQHWHGVNLAEADGRHFEINREYRCISQQGEIVLTNNLASFCSQRGLSAKSLSNSGSSKRKGGQNWHRGWRVEYLDSAKEFSDTIYVVTSPDGSEIETRSLSEFAADRGLKKQNFYYALKGQASHAYGFRINIKGKPIEKFKKLSKCGKRPAWLVTSPSGEIREIKNLKQFCLDNDLTNPLMHNVSTGKAKHHKGWKCERIKQ